MMQGSRIAGGLVFYWDRLNNPKSTRFLRKCRKTKKDHKISFPRFLGSQFVTAKAALPNNPRLVLQKISK